MILINLLWNNTWLANFKLNALRQSPLVAQRSPSYSARKKVRRNTEMNATIYQEMTFFLFYLFIYFWKRVENNFFYDLHFCISYNCLHSPELLPSAQDFAFMSNKPFTFLTFRKKPKPTAR